MLFEFVQKWYVDPVIYNTGYNPVNTATYGILLIAAATGVYYLLKRFRVPIDHKFLAALAPYIFLGAMLRSYEDLLESMNLSLNFLTVASAEGPRNMLLVSPVIYVTIFLFTLAALALSLGISRVSKLPYQKILFAIGAIGALAVFSAIVPHVMDFFAVSLMLSLAAFWAAAIFAFRKYLAPKYEKFSFLTKENALIICAHMFDASTTFTALQFYPYFEQHFLPRFVISLLGPAAMFLLKLAVVPLALYYIDKELPDTGKRTFFKLIILVLGLGPGLRNFFRLAMGV